MDEDSIVSYFEGCVDEIVKEIAVMSSLKNHPNIVTYEDHHVERDTEEFGWYILIRMELLTPLQDYQLSHNMTEKEIVQMARDICNALVYCQQKQIIHRDIKPENIFINELGEYKLGDFGVARSLDKTKGGLSVKATIGYMAPEVYLGKPYGVSVDTYSVGLMMYRMLNGNRMPFFPPAPQPITYQDKENAMVRRMQGDAFPRPLYGSELLKDVILKACAYNSSDRYRTAWEMLDALNRCGQQSYTQQAEKVEIEEEPKAIKKPVMRNEEEKDSKDSNKIVKEKDKKKGIRYILIAILSILILVGGGVGYSYYNQTGSAEEYGLTEEKIKDYAEGVIETMEQIVADRTQIEQYKSEKVIYNALNNYAEIREIAGDYREIVEYDITYRNGIIIEAIINCSLKQAEVKIVLDEDLEVVKISTK